MKAETPVKTADAFRMKAAVEQRADPRIDAVPVDGRLIKIHG